MSFWCSFRLGVKGPQTSTSPFPLKAPERLSCQANHSENAFVGTSKTRDFEERAKASMHSGILVWKRAAWPNCTQGRWDSGRANASGCLGADLLFGLQRYRGLLFRHRISKKETRYLCELSCLSHVCLHQRRSNNSQQLRNRRGVPLGGLPLWLPPSAALSGPRYNLI